jgi:serine/threonine-protein kinase RIO1
MQESFGKYTAKNSKKDDYYSKLQQITASYNKLQQVTTSHIPLPEPYTFVQN